MSEKNNQSNNQLSNQQKTAKVDDILRVNLYDVEETPHITVDFNLCVKCDTKPCARLCPGECFTTVGEKVLYSYEGCLECGTCRVICPHKAVSWSYPRSGKGVQYRYT